MRLQIRFLKRAKLTPNVRASVLSVGTGQRHVAKGCLGTVHVQLFLVWRMKFHVPREIALAAKLLAANGTGSLSLSLNRVDK